MAQSALSAPVDGLVIIGGGPSAVAMLGAVLRQGSTRQIVIVDPNPIGIGNAFGPLCAGDPALLCNTSIGTMFLDDEQRDEFLHFLQDRGWAVSPHDCTPRYMFGEFCRETYRRHLKSAAAAGVTVHHVRRRATAIESGGNGSYEVTLEDDEQLHASALVLCAGLEAPQVPAELQPHVHDPAFVNGAYPARRLRSLESGAKTLVVGMRSSGLDAMNTLCRAGHRVTMTSPSGEISAIRDRLAITPEGAFDAEQWQRLDVSSPTVVDDVTTLLRQTLDSVSDGLALDRQISDEPDPESRFRASLPLASAGLTRWADVCFDVVAWVNHLVGPLGPDERARVLPLIYRQLTRYVNAIPLLVAERLLEHLDSGAATISRHYLDQVRRTPQGWEVTWDNSVVETFDFIVAASGIHFPRFYTDGQGRMVFRDTGSDTDGLAAVSIGSDLRVRLPGNDGLARIWAVGPSTHQRLPMAQVIFLTAMQVDDVARSIATSLSAQPDARHDTAPLRTHELEQETSAC